MKIYIDRDNADGDNVDEAKEFTHSIPNKVIFSLIEVIQLTLECKLQVTKLLEVRRFVPFTRFSMHPLPFGSIFLSDR